MLRIAICDDDQALLHSYKNRIKALFESKHVDAIIFDYTKGSKLITECKEVAFDLIFLDIDMPEMSGFDVAEKINDINADTVIIFVTNEEQLVYRSLRYSPFRFIRKAYFVAELSEAIISFLDMYLKRNKTQVFNCINGEIVAINIKDIMYIESNKHKVTVYTQKKDIVTKAKIGELEENLKDFGFIRVHIGYLINMKYIFSIEKTEIIFVNQTSVPMSRHRTEQVKTEFHKYIRSDL
ncbi:two component transcriptional regulator, LytTR family [Anaerosporobacter mobilis DSM 15930]|jgi:DNA-binding LytR/AlgR family response regulator|uniref:Stage 0 sporulation protein A homolog n=1 Tax=Anaerosporobacter mobilis DSM 15930 TaxID=1120996 RepID=A0A1M7L4F8_9FIRM|nr:LytTR family DNA-binding domain-containing protein [Anaerosporobacter mobilis]SHM72172.1 two component transcriptional regulator, LytTR family [Anaerosporobacter mobilis DSM 15930]